ncbi:MAG: GTPase ObgE [Deltaproteobacteria bacterium]|nr:GTPase ObgE [Deltaproteobacteria bacterium]
MSFIDEAKFFVKAGDGGRGCVSFRREKYVPRGGPDGGDGGRGGSVYIEASPRLQSLIDFKYRSHFIAKSGAHGKGKKMHGQRGKDCVIEVPLGSLVKDAETGEVIVDLVEAGQRYLAARGGLGGRGNVHFASATNRAPRIADKGMPGEERWLRIELKLIADVGLIGLPNAGKSTLLSRLSAANPKVAPYPFTTLDPQLGVVNFAYGESCILADIPGLIEGAHAGAGLGHKFLRHVERTRILLHVIDATGMEDDPWHQYQVLENELAQFNAELIDRKRLVLLNKTDLMSPEYVAQVTARFQEAEIPHLVISAETGAGLDALKEWLAEILFEGDEGHA